MPNPSIGEIATLPAEGEGREHEQVEQGSMSTPPPIACQFAR